MIKTEIYRDTEYDRNIFFIYECEDSLELRKRLLGINFHQGCDDLDMSFSKNDAELLDIFLMISANHPQGKPFNKIRVTNRAIEAYMIIKNDIL